MINFAVLGLSIFVYLIDNRYSQDKNKIATGRISTVFLSALLFVMSAVRFENVRLSDFAINYLRVIQAKSMTWTECFTSGLAIGNAVIRKVIAEVFHDPQWYFIIAAFLVVYSVYHTTRLYSPNMFLTIFLFYTIGTYFTSNNITRQATAAAIILFSWKYIFNSDLIKYLLLVLLASTIHISAIFFLPMYFLCRIKLGRNQYIFYILLGIGLFLVRNPLIRFFRDLAFSNYTDTSYGTTGSSPLRLLLTILVAIYLYIYSKNNDKIKPIIQQTIPGGDPELFYYFIGHSTVINIFLSVLSVTNMLLMSRLAMFWNFQSLICISYAVKSLKRKQMIWFIMLIVLAAILWFVIMEVTGKHIPTPYTPFWEFPDRSKI